MSPAKSRWSQPRGCLYRLSRKYRRLTAANFEFVAVRIFEEKGVVTGTVVFAKFRSLRIFRSGVKHKVSNAIHFFARVCPKRDPRLVGFMVFIPGKAKKFLLVVAAAIGIKSMVSAPFFVTESELR